MTGCIVCGAECEPATLATITCVNGHRVSLNPDIESSPEVTPEHILVLMERFDRWMS